MVLSRKEPRNPCCIACGSGNFFFLLKLTLVVEIMLSDYISIIIHPAGYWS